jgi:hypothetical protein
MMELKIAKHVVRTAAGASADLASLLPLLKENCAKGEYELVAKAIATILAEISFEIMNPIFRNFPQVEVEVNDEIEEFGKIL